MLTEKLKNKDIPFQYDMIDSLPEDVADRILDLANQAGIRTFPIVMNEQAEIVSAQEVLACC